jgi:hypothetical protein
MSMVSQASFLDTIPSGYHEVPAGAKPERCRSCGATVVWAKTSRGADIPLNVEKQLSIAGKQYGQTHFITCPHGREWRRH